MTIEHSITRFVPRFAFRSHQRDTVLACEHASGECPVDALRAALSREAALISQKDVLIQEQEILRRESDHRLLNGLQIVSSLLHLQSRSAATPDVALQLAVAANRVSTIQRVHSRLHFNDGTQSVAFKAYLEEFCRDFSGLAASEEGPEQLFLVEGAEVDLPTSVAIPLGFIVNELLTNAVKHGKGRILIELCRRPGKGHVLAVSNEGAALPEDFTPSASKGLGMKIIQSLVRQIGGELQFGRGDRNQGAKFVVLFP